MTAVRHACNVGNIAMLVVFAIFLLDKLQGHGGDLEY